MLTSPSYPVLNKKLTKNVTFHCRVHDAAWTRVNDADLDVLEGRLDSMISKFRRVKFLRLQLQKQELEDTKKCRLCQVFLQLLVCSTDLLHLL
jgi:hypothetical protein